MNKKQLIKIVGLTVALGAVLGYAVHNAKKMADARLVMNEEIIEVRPEECATK